MLLLVLSFYFFIDDLLGKSLLIVVLLYFLWLIYHKYQGLFKCTLIVICFFVVVCWFKQQQEQKIDLNQQTKILVYPDEVKIKDHWLSGIARVRKQKILLTGKINSGNSCLLRKGNPILLTDITGKFDKVPPATNYGEFNLQKYYEAKGIYQRIKLDSFKSQLIRVNCFDYLHKIRYCLQCYLSKLPPLISFFAGELFLAQDLSQGEIQQIDHYRDLGIIHLLSISGLHVSLYTLFISTICFWLKLNEKQAWFICFFVLILGIFLSRGQAGFVRASFSFLLGKLFLFNKWKLSRLDLLGLVVLLHLFLVPKLFLGTGAILSYILALGLQITKKFSKLVQSIMLNLLLTPFLLLFFFQTNLLTFVFNFLAVPYFNFVVLPLTFFSVLTATHLPAISKLAEKILSLTEMIIAKLAQTKIGLLTFGKINCWQCLFLLFMTIWLITVFGNPSGCKVKKKAVASLSLVYLIFFGMIHFPLRGQVTFIDVGQGDSILVTTPFPRQVYLIDTGGKLNFAGHKVNPQINRITLPYLKALGISKINGVLVSHQDADHVGDLRPLLSQVQVEKLYLAQGILENKAFKKRIDGVVNHTKIVQLLAGNLVSEKQLNAQVVYPFKSGLGKNEDSLSLTFVLGHKRWLFTGDLGQEGEKEIARNFPMQVDYFKLGHHGSKTSSNPDFLHQIKPKMVFISAGRNNRFGHPHQETLETLRREQIPWVSTQDYGMITWYYGLGKPEFRTFYRSR